MQTQSFTLMILPSVEILKMFFHYVLRANITPDQNEAVTWFTSNELQYNPEKTLDMKLSYLLLFNLNL